MKIKEFVNHGLIYGFGGAVAKFSGLITVPIYTRFLDTEGFGELDLFTTILAILIVLSTLEIQSGFGRSYYESQKKNNLNELTGSVLLYTLIVGLIIILTVISFYFYTKDWFHEFNILLIVPVAANVLPINLLGIALVALRFEKKPFIYTVFTFFSTFLTALSGVIAVAIFDLGVLGILWSNVLVSYLIAIPAIIVLYKLSKFKYSYKYIGETIKYGAPLTPAVLGTWVNESACRFFIIASLSYSSLGIYALGLKIALVMKLAGTAFDLTWSPLQIKLFDKINSEEKFPKFINYYLIVMFLFLIFITSFSPSIVSILATPNFYSIIPLVGIMTASYFWENCNSIFGSGIAWSRKTYFNSLVSVASSLIILFILWMSVERFGLIAAAISLMIGSIIKSILMVATSQYVHKIPYSYKNIGLSIILVTSFSFLSCAIFYNFEHTFLLKGVIVLIVGIVHFFIMTFFILSEKEIRAFLVYFKGLIN